MTTSPPMTETRPLRRHPTQWHLVPGAAEPVANFVAGKSVHVVDVAEYELYRSMLYGLGAKGVSNKKLAGVDLIVHGRGEAPKPVRTKYPAGEYVRADAVLPLFHQEVRSFGEFVRALRGHGFTVRNPSDEGDPEFDYFELPLVGGSLHETLLQYLGTSTFIRGFSANQTTPRLDRDAAYSEFVVPNTGRTWYYLWNVDAWSRVSAQRGEGDYPLEIKGPQLLTIAPVVWTESTGLYFHEHPHIDSVNGLFIQAGVDARTGLASGVAISRVWT